jgi:hypothetical protein
MFADNVVPVYSTIVTDPIKLELSVFQIGRNYSGS